MEHIKTGAQVKAATTTGAKGFAPGKLVKRHKTPKGDWLEIKPADGSPNFKTRPSHVQPA